MLDTGPTAAIFIRQQLLASYAPSLLNVLQGVGAASNEKIKIISLDDNRPYRPNSPTAAFDSKKYPNVDFVRLNTGELLLVDFLFHRHPDRREGPPRRQLTTQKSQ